MKLSPKTTIIAPEKLRNYLLDTSHSDGKSKALFLKKMGYEKKNWQALENDLRAQHLTIDVTRRMQSIYGEKFIIVAPLRGPNGISRRVRSIWIIRQGETVARFVTLVPEK